MRAVVVYESIFGNTKQVAEAIGDGLRERIDEVAVIEVGSAAERLEGVDLLVVGGPTHGWGMSRATSRRDARNRARQHGVEPVSADVGVREWIERLGEGDGTAAATFDTVVRTGWIPSGSAAKRAAALLARNGHPQLVDPEHFCVGDVEGPLLAGELERARAWGTRIAEIRRGIDGPGTAPSAV